MGIAEDDTIAAHAAPGNPLSLGAGHVIAGRYQLERELGRGGMGSVWKALHLSLRSNVAIKLIDPANADSKLAVSRFLREAQAARKAQPCRSRAATFSRPSRT